MRTSTDHILTTHVASLPRPDSLLALMRAKTYGGSYDQATLTAEIDQAVDDVVKRQQDTGIDVPSDGEMSKPSFLHYVKERLTGVETTDRPMPWYLEGSREVKAYPQHYKNELKKNPLPPMKITACTGPIKYRGHDLVQADIARFKGALAKHKVQEGFLPAISAPNVEFWVRNEYYKTDEEFLSALADAMNEEYKAIAASGIILQIDDPRLATQFTLDADMTVPQFRKWAEKHVEVINHSLRGIPPEKIRFHTCYSLECGPRTTDMELKDFVDIMLKIKAGAFSFEASNPRHEHEWKVWKGTKIADDKLLIPGVITNSTMLVEHPELVCDRILKFTDIVGKDRVLAGADCGFGTFAGDMPFGEEVVWAKFDSLVAGARLASKALGMKSAA